jgi:hypothetical protein
LVVDWSICDVFCLQVNAIALVAGCALLFVGVFVWKIFALAKFYVFVLCLVRKNVIEFGLWL